MSYTALGKHVAELGVEVSKLEQFVCSFEEKDIITHDEAVEMVTGFVDGLIKENDPIKAYLIVNGFGKSLYKGDLEEVRERIFKKMAEIVKLSRHQSELYNYPMRIREFFEKIGDSDGFDAVAVLCVKLDPHRALDWVSEKGREKVLREIVEQHKDSKEGYMRWRAKDALEELKDVDGLKGMVNDYISREDYQGAWGILEEYGTLDELREFDSKIPPGADKRFLYNMWFTIVKKAEEAGELTEGDTFRYKHVRHDFITNEDSDRVGEILMSHEDSEGLVMLAKSLLKLPLPKASVKAIKWFIQVGYDGSEYRDALVEMMRQVEAKKIKDPAGALKGEKISRKMKGINIKDVVANAAIAYYEEGGNALITNEYVSKGNFRITDDFKRKIAKELADNPKAKATDAYQWITKISERKRTGEDNELIAELRPRVISEQGFYGAKNIFLMDEEGKRMAVEKFYKKHPGDALERAGYLKDEELQQKCREHIMTLGLGKAKEIFEEKHDREGLKMVEERLYEGVKPEVVDALTKEKLEAKR